MTNHALPTGIRKVLFVAFLSCGALSIAPGAARAQTPPAVAAPTDEFAALKAENARLRTLIPSQSHAMMDVGYHFTNLWFAGEASNWPLAQFYLNEVRNHIKWSIRLVPKRRTKNGEVNLTEKFEPFDGVLLAEIQKQIAAQDRKLFGVAYRDTTTGCNDCHAASDKPYLHVTVPHRATAEGIEFSPQKMH